VRAFGREWTLGVVPTVEQIRITRSNVPIAFLVVGLSCAVFLGWTVRLAQRSREQTLRVARVAEQLSAENVARRAAELELEAQAEELMAQSEELEQQNAMLQDIAAELEEQRDALERAQEFKAALVRSSTGGIAAYDAGGLVNAWNPAMEALTGTPRTDAIGRAFHGTLTFLTREEEARLMAEGLAGRASRLDDLRARAAERNDVSWLDVIATPMLGTDGRVIGVLVVARDVTERKRAADSILASKYEAEQASRAKSDFMARMSHELRTPLNSVIGFSNILLRNKDSQLGASDLTYLARIRANGRHLLSLINQILDLSKVEAGHETVVLVPTAIGPLVTDTIAELDVRASEAQLVLQTCVPDGLDDVVTDPEKLKQVLINLIGNAIKFTPPSGKVTVSVIPAAVVGMPMRIEVEDTGIGIPEDRLLAIFEAFEQADEETSRVYGGTGLGLAISQKLCALMGHDLIVHSVQGAGSTFAVLLYPGETCRAA
jgi:PAS domain S-box-containing protein